MNLFDFHYIMDEFRSNLKNFWNVDANETFSLLLKKLIVLVIVSTTEARESPDETQTTVTAVQDSDEDGSGQFAANNAFLGNLDLDELSYATLITIFVVATIITAIGMIDAKFVRHNELFKIITMIVVVMYLMDVVSGVYFAFFLWFVLLTLCPPRPQTFL